MRVHHLNCGTMRPFGGRMINGSRPPFLSAKMVCHCLLIEGAESLVLVDSGFGLSDVQRLGSAWSMLRPPTDDAGLAMGTVRTAYATFIARARIDPKETAVRQIARLGFDPRDVRHVVLTHLDLDHAGGLPDFPQAAVHVHAAEHSAAMSARRSSTATDRFRYWGRHWAHGPNWVTYETDGDRWFGFEAVRELEGASDVALIALPGHTRGHSGVAVRTTRAGGRGSEWLLHAGDAYFDHREIDAARPQKTPGLAGFQKRFDVDRAARRANQGRLRELVASHGDEVEVFSAHDPEELARYTPC